MPQYLGAGTANRLTATGVSTITSGNARIIGFLFTGTGTGTLQLFAGATASSAISGVIRAYVTVGGVTVNTATFVEYPAYASGGFTVDVGPTADPDVTIFWNPAGG